MAFGTYDEGSLVRVTTAAPDGNPPGFVDENGNVADPTVVVFRYSQEGQPTITLVYSVDAALARDSTGIYHVDIDTSAKPGRWLYRWQGSGTIQAAFDGMFLVGDSPLV